MVNWLNLFQVFKQNMPSHRWARSFIARHGLTIRYADNVKVSRAAVDQTAVNEYFDNLETSLANVEPENVFNFDETNISDNPGKRKVLHY